MIFGLFEVLQQHLHTLILIVHKMNIKIEMGFSQLQKEHQHEYICIHM